MTIRSRDFMSAVKPINDSKLQYRINLNNKERLYLREAQIALECGVLLANNAVC